MLGTLWGVVVLMLIGFDMVVWLLSFFFYGLLLFIFFFAYCVAQQSQGYLNLLKEQCIGLGI